MKNHFKFSLLLSLLFSMGMLSVQAQELIKKSFSGIQKLEIKSSGIAIEYEGQVGLQELSLEALLGSNEISDKSLLMVTVGNTLKIAYNPPKGSWNSKKQIYLKGPANMILDIKSGSGSLAVSGITSNETHLEVSSGQINATNLTGNTWIKGSSGNLNLQNINGDVTCRLTSGNASIADIKGDLDFKATSGQLKAESVTGLLNASLTSGNIRLNRIGELGSLEITSGNIRADHAGLGRSTQLNGSSGNIQISTASDFDQYNFDLQAGSGNIRIDRQSKSKSLVIQNGNFPTIRGKISSGNIVIQPI
ncbi:DUF4097 family beta strand repeat-containing protein [Cyclobacterium plantarum]|uniref:DUF4097 domain-containing protein n=1 Tax=Cyclobacterium plantarum TaxID=2716263 RepID=A0ABX0H5R0_9BACT|nr:DUF4097 family beta strand repeat-containing protein [Cyclobacterium plantarum]NHE55582.1 DUF4097 domain-containing protein [Cyclobacterium plantarum]